MACRKSIALFFCFLAFGHASIARAASEIQNIVLLPVRYQLVSEDIGKLKYGWACLPGGKVTWGKLSRPDQDQIHDRLERDLAAVGVRATPQRGEPWNVALQDANFLRTTVLDVHMDICAPYMNIGEMKVKGKGAITVRWELLDGAGNVIKNEVRQSDIDLMRRDPRVESGVLLDVIAQSAVGFLRSYRNMD